MNLQGRKNIYICSKGDKTITVDKDQGVTPMFIECRAGDEVCKERASSSFYQVDQSVSPDWEWYKPDAEEMAKLDGHTLDHVKQGGLLIRKIEHYA